MHRASLTDPRTFYRTLVSFLLVVLGGLALGLSAPDASANVAVKAARLGSNAGAQRIVLELTEPITYKYFLLSNPSRLVLDLDEVDPHSAMLKGLAGRIPADDPHIAGVRIAPNRPGVARLVADLKSVMRPTIFLLPESVEFGPRLVIDLMPVANSGKTPVPVAPAVIAAPAAKPAAPTAVSEPIGRAAVTVDRETGDSSARAKVSAVGFREEGAKLAEARATPDKAAARKAARNDSGKPTLAADGARGEKTSHVSMSADNSVAEPGQEKTPAGAEASANLEKQVEHAIQQADGVNDNAEAKGIRAARKADPAYKRLVTVAIDPGHGGVDPGAVGANGSHEKDITLAVARRLKSHIERHEGMRAVLTRDGDYFIPLHDRVNKARRFQADLFVSIHADAFLKTSAKGSSVFALSEKGATSAAARWLAKRENEADLIGGINIDVKDVYLKRTLIDLSQTATIADSLKLGRAVLDELGEINDLHKAHVEQAGFAVLKAPDIPSILIETAFISNPDEEKRLLDEEYQEKMAAAIVAGIKDYFENNPPLARTKVARNL